LSDGYILPRSQAPAWERICVRSPGFGPSPVTGSRGFPGKCVPKPGLGNEKNQAVLCRTHVKKRVCQRTPAYHPSADCWRAW